MLVADRKGKPIGFIHYAMHEDVIDGGSNAFITAFYVAPEFRDKGVGSKLLRTAIEDALKKGAVGIETSKTTVFILAMVVDAAISNRYSILVPWVK